MADDARLIQPLELDPSDFPPLPLDPGFTQLADDTLGNQGTPIDGFDQVFADVVGIVDALDAALGSLANDLLDAFAEADLIDPTAASDNLVSFSAALPVADAAVGNLGNLLATSSAPPAPGGGAPPAPAPSSDCSKRTNQYGISKTGAFAGFACTQKLAFQVLRAQDGPCTFSAAPGAQAGATRLPAVTSFTLESGNTAIWKLGHHTAQASDGTPFDVYDIGITPAAPGHYDATGVLTLDHPHQVQRLCMSVDVIP